MSSHGSTKKWNPVSLPGTRYMKLTKKKTNYCTGDMLDCFISFNKHLPHLIAISSCLQKQPHTGCTFQVKSTNPKKILHRSYRTSFVVRRWVIWTTPFLNPPWKPKKRKIICRTIKVFSLLAVWWFCWIQNCPNSSLTLTMAVKKRLPSIFTINKYDISYCNYTTHHNQLSCSQPTQNPTCPVSICFVKALPIWQAAARAVSWELLRWWRSAWKHSCRKGSSSPKGSPTISGFETGEVWDYDKW